MGKILSLYSVTKHAVISAEPGFHLLAFKSQDIKFVSLPTSPINTNSEPTLWQSGELLISFSHSYLLPMLSRITKNTGQIVFYFFPVSMGKVGLIYFFISVCSNIKFNLVCSLPHVIALEVTPLSVFCMCCWKYRISIPCLSFSACTQHHSTSTYTSHMAFGDHIYVSKMHRPLLIQSPWKQMTRNCVKVNKYKFRI